MTLPFPILPDATAVAVPRPTALPQPVIKALQAVAARRQVPAPQLDTRALETGGNVGTEGYGLSKLLYDLAHGRGAFAPNRPAGAAADLLEVPGLVRGATSMYDLVQQGHPIAGATVGLASVVPGIGGPARDVVRAGVRDAEQAAARDVLTASMRAGENVGMGNAQAVKDFEAWYADHLARRERDVSPEAHAAAYEATIKQPDLIPFADHIQLPSGKDVVGALNAHPAMRDAGIMVEEAPNFRRRPTDAEWRFIRSQPAYQAADANADAIHAAATNAKAQAQARVQSIAEASRAYDRELGAAVESTGEPIFVRFGAPPESGRSFNHRESKAEAGVSVYPAYRIGKRIFLDLRGIDQMTAARVMDRPDIYQVFGKAVDIGGDNEPILAASNVRKLPRGTQVGAFHSVATQPDADALYRKYGITPPGGR